MLLDLEMLLLPWFRGDVCPLDYSLYFQCILSPFTWSCSKSSKHFSKENIETLTWVNIIPMGFWGSYLLSLPLETWRAVICPLPHSTAEDYKLTEVPMKSRNHRGSENPLHGASCSFSSLLRGSHQSVSFVKCQLILEWCEESLWVYSIANCWITGG